MGIIFQNFNLLPSWTALENVEAAMLHTNIPRAERRDKANAILCNFGLDNRARNKPDELSVGQQQLVAVARLASPPAPILADEPTGDLDSGNAKQILAHLTAAAAKNGSSMIVVLHWRFPDERLNAQSPSCRRKDPLRERGCVSSASAAHGSFLYLPDVAPIRTSKTCCTSFCLSYRLNLGTHYPIADSAGPRSGRCLLCAPSSVQGPTLRMAGVQSLLRKIIRHR